MSACEPNQFQLFSPGGSYPHPISQYAPSGPHPTNSWFQNAISNNIDDNTRYINTFPWYFIPQYHKKTYVGVSLDTPLNQNTSVTLNNGNFAYQFSPSHSIIIGKTNNSGQSLQTSALDDFTSTLSLILSGGGSVDFFPLRGSPFATLKYNNAKFDLLFETQGITSLSPIANGFQVDTAGSKVSSATEQLYQNELGEFQSKFLVIYNDVIPSTDKVEVTLTSGLVTFKSLN